MSYSNSQPLLNNNQFIESILIESDHDISRSSSDEEFIVSSDEESSSTTDNETTDDRVSDISSQKITPTTPFKTNKILGFSFNSTSSRSSFINSFISIKIIIIKWNTYTIININFKQISTNTYSTKT
jgi:hypothetical protein